MRQSIKFAQKSIDLARSVHSKVDTVLNSLKSPSTNESNERTFYMYSVDLQSHHTQLYYMLYYIVQLPVLLVVDLASKGDTVLKKYMICRFVHPLTE